MWTTFNYLTRNRSYSWDSLVYPNSNRSQTCLLSRIGQRIFRYAVFEISADIFHTRRVKRRRVGLERKSRKTKRQWFRFVEVTERDERACLGESVGKRSTWLAYRVFDVGEYRFRLETRFSLRWPRFNLPTSSQRDCSMLRLSGC